MSGERPGDTPADPSLVVAPQGPAETEIDPALEPVQSTDDPPAN